jgi:hypothetical protein
MSTKLILEYAMFLEVAGAWGLLAILLWKRLAQDFSFLTGYVLAVSLDLTTRTLLLFFRPWLGLSPIQDYAVYFYSSWAWAFVEHALMFFIIYQIFRQAMTPFKGLRRLGNMLFQWVASVAVLVTVCVLVVPGHITVDRYLAIIPQFEQSIGILTICLLLFVCFAIRHLGLTYRSHLFGASLGLGMSGSITLAITYWVTAQGPKPPALYSLPYVFASLCGTVTFMVWGGYFLIPEARRELVLLPTTSPYFVWNEISAALGDHPGVVAVSGFTPDSLSPAERLVLGASARRDSVAAKVRVAVAEQATATGTQR